MHFHYVRRWHAQTPKPLLAIVLALSHLALGLVSCLPPGVRPARKFLHAQLSLNPMFAQS